MSLISFIVTAFIGALFLFFVSLIISNNILLNIITSLCSSIILTLLVKLNNIILVHGKNLKIYFKTKVHTLILKKYKKIRVSMSYIFMIKINNEYLLTKNKRYGYFQPVGGVYKVIPQSKGILDQFNWKDDNNFKSTEINYDFRGFILGNTLLNFLKWFSEGKNREIGHQREFYEEVIKEDKKFQKLFPYIDYEFLRRENTGIQFSEHFKCMEYISYDILKLHLNEEQKEAFKELAKNNENFELANEEMIERGGFCPVEKINKFNIGKHSQYLIK